MKKFILVILMMFFVLFPSIVFAIGQGVNLVDYDPNIEININIDPNGPGACGSAVYAIKRVNIDPNSSVNLAFGFVAEKVIVETAASNTQEIVVDWLGGTAVTPSANTAGDDLIDPGRSIVFDDYQVTSISVRSAGAGSQTVKVRAFK